MRRKLSDCVIRWIDYETCRLESEYSQDGFTVVRTEDNFACSHLIHKRDLDKTILKVLQFAVGEFVCFLTNRCNPDSLQFGFGRHCVPRASIHEKVFRK